MKREELICPSTWLERDMEVLCYTAESGAKGIAVLVIPPEGGPCKKYEQGGMIDAIKDYIEEGKIQVFVTDTTDWESWFNTTLDTHDRGLRQETFYHYVVDELVPWIHKENGSDRPLTVTGCGLGATQAGILALRRPDLFEGLIALSGAYDASYFTRGYMDGVWYDNSPAHFLPNMPVTHPYVELYNQKSFVFCVGQGEQEEEGIRTCHVLQDTFRAKGIRIWVDFWGYDVSHDWNWWKKQIRYFLPFTIDHYQRRGLV